jgi:hypothetical protein
MADTLIARLTGTGTIAGAGAADPTPAPTDEPRTTTGETATTTGETATGTSAPDSTPTPTDEPDTAPADHSDRPHPAADPTGTVTDHADRDPSDTPLPAGINLDIQLVMTDRTLLDGDDSPALLIGHPLPAPISHRLLAGAGRNVRMWVRRLFTAPTTGELTNCDQNRRLIPETVRGFLLTRDQVCRTPWCGAPIRHGDHIVPFADGGLTSIDNVQGLCENCNYAKQLPGWTTTRLPDGTIQTTTPTGHRYDSRPPPPPRSEPWTDERVRGTSGARTG